MMTIDVPGGPGPQDLFGNGTCSGTPGCMGSGVGIWSLDNTPVAITENATNFGRINSWSASLQDGTDGSDPFVFTQITVVNDTATTQAYIVEVILPLAAATSYIGQLGSMTAGITDSGQISDQPGIWAYADQVGGGFNYTGEVNNGGLLERNLNPVPMNVTSSGGSASQNHTFGFESVTPGTANDISMRLAFELSHGDELTISGFYQVVPEPSTALLLGLGIVGMGIARRRV